MNITLATLHLFTAQQVFEKVATHLLTQNAKSESEAEICQYRTKSGLMCAAGCLIADEEYDSKMEGYNWCHGRFPDVHKHLIADLQKLHDLDDVEDWYDGLLGIAKDYKLNTDFIENIK